MLRANLAASINGDRRIRNLRPSRSFESRLISLDSPTAVAMNSSGVRAASSARPALDRMLKPARDCGVAAQAHHGHAHPQGIERRRAAAIWIRIKPDINLPIGGKVIGWREVSNEFDSPRID